MTAEDINRAYAAANPGNLGGRGELIAANREGYTLRFGELEFEWLPCGRVLVSLPPTLLPFGVAVRANVVYRDLGAFITAMRRLRP